MQGQPRHFETIGSRLGFQIREETPQRLFLTWQGTRFPGWLCLGLAIFLLFLSVPILQAIKLQGFASRVGALWYFPLMNLLLLGIGVFLVSVRRSITLDRQSARVLLKKETLVSRRVLQLDFPEIVSLKVGADQLYSGPAVAGSTVGQSFFPVQSLRLVLNGGETVLLERGSRKRVENLGERLSIFLEKPLAKNR
ncbi:MAG: hypothetical protein ACREQW_19530 [Candidatus Binatia bacterium]